MDGYKIEMQQASEWRCELFGMGNSIVVNPNKGDVPNLFWRWMQFIFFGNRWVKNR